MTTSSYERFNFPFKTSDGRLGYILKGYLEGVTNIISRWGAYSTFNIISMFSEFHVLRNLFAVPKLKSLKHIIQAPHGKKLRFPMLLSSYPKKRKKMKLSILFSTSCYELRQKFRTETMIVYTEMKWTKFNSKYQTNRHFLALIHFQEFESTVSVSNTGDILEKWNWL